MIYMYIENNIVNKNDLLYIIEYFHSNILLFIMTPISYKLC